jgi:BolA protein
MDFRGNTDKAPRCLDLMWVCSMGEMAESIERKVKSALAPQRFEIVDESSRHAGHAGARSEGESHFRIVVVSAAFDGKPRVQRQQMVYAALGDEFARGLHALAMTTLTPAEDAARR